MELSRSLKRYIASTIITSTVVFSAQSFAGAFQLWEESASSLGDYHAGAAAEANNASTVFYNPAGMTRIHNQQVSFGVIFIPVQMSFDGQVYLGGFAYGTPTGPGGAPGDTFNIIPNFHYVLPFAQRWALGLEETTPFGLATKFDDPNNDNDNVDTLATTTNLQTINLNPSLAYKVNQHLSVAAGFDAMQGSAVYNNISLLGPLKNDLNGWGYGYNAGILVQFTPTTRAGLSYRSPVTIDATGPSQYVFGGVVQNSSTVSADFPLPATTMLSVYHDMTQRWAMMASAFYTQWSCFRELVIKNMAIPGGTGTVALFQHYRNTWNLAIGTRYKFNQHIAIEAGFGHDETPTRIPYRDIRLPDNNRYAASLGLNIHPSKTFEWSMGWTHLFTERTPVDNSGSLDTNQTSPSITSLFTTGIGTVYSNVNVFGTQFTWDI